LARVGTDNAQGEYYLTDVVEEFHRSGREVIGVVVDDAREALGISNQGDLEQASELIGEMTADVVS
jgi:bifunctional UDP-N-acetylglucosamine pyrophosphorylase/glucosamine-1-phosphate N-acetyltransferase